MLPPPPHPPLGVGVVWTPYTEILCPLSLPRWSEVAKLPGKSQQTPTSMVLKKIVFFANGLHAQCHRIRHGHIPAILVASLCLPAWPWPSSPTCDKQILRPLHFYLPTIFRGPTQKCHPRSSTRCQNSGNYFYISNL